MNHSTKVLQKKGMLYFMDRCKAGLNNIVYKGYERDILLLDSKNRTIEIECKISRSDFLADKLKTDKHSQTESGNGVNYFWYLIDAKVDFQTVPDWAGLIRLDEKGFIRIMKQAPLIHNFLITLSDSVDLLHKLFMKKTNFGID